MKGYAGCILAWQLLSSEGCNSSLQHRKEENRANYDREEKTLYIKESEIILWFLKYQDVHCILAHITVPLFENLWKKNKQPFFMMFSSVGERTSVQNIVLALYCPEQTEEGTETAFLSHGPVSFIHLFIALLLNLSLHWHGNSLKSQ